MKQPSTQPSDSYQPEVFTCPPSSETIGQTTAPCVSAPPDGGEAAKEAVFEPGELRDISWQIGIRYPASFCMEGIALLPVSCNNGFINWHVNDLTVSRLIDSHGPAWHGARPVLRIYDVTDMEFNGFNAHRHHDIAIGSLSGNYYLRIDEHGRNFLAEMGFVLTSGRFVPCVRSNTMRFDRPGRSSIRDGSGLYVGSGFAPVVRISAMQCAPVFSRMAKALRDAGNPAISVAMFLAESAVMAPSNPNGPLTESLRRIVQACSTFGVRARLFASALDESGTTGGLEPTERADRAAESMSRQFAQEQFRAPFSCIQCHDWYSAPAAIEAAAWYDLPLIYVLHSTEGERSGGESDGELSRRIKERERAAIEAAACVLAARESTLDSLRREYGKPACPTGIVPDLVDKANWGGDIGREVRRRFGFDGQGPIALFAGEIAHHTGADLLFEAILCASREGALAHFVFAGEGCLKEELSRRAWQSGLGRTCHFLGDLTGESFDPLFDICDFVAFPARSPQDGGLARRAIHHGKPVLATHQARLPDIVHGVNGVVIYDNPGSVTWGLREMLNNPPPLIGVSGRGKHQNNAECIAALYITHWAALAARREGRGERVA